MNTNVVARFLGAIALCLATSFVPAAGTRDDGFIRQLDEAVPAGSSGRTDRFVRSDRTVHVAVPDAFPFDEMLIARLDGLNLSDRAFVESRFTAPSGSWSVATVDVAPQASRFGLRLPEPGPMTAVLATLALGLFFFLRRIV